MAKVNFQEQVHHQRYGSVMHDPGDTYYLKQWVHRNMYCMHPKSEFWVPVFFKGCFSKTIKKKKQCPTYKLQKQ